jgi:hypothetical protein
MFDHRHSNITDWITHALNNLNTEDLIYMAAIAYGIWFARNQMIFESTEMDDDKVINNATKCIQEFQRATQIPSSESINTNYDTSSNHRPRLRPTTNKHWSRPNEGTIKVNCDANLSREGRWGLGAFFTIPTVRSWRQQRGNYQVQMMQLWRRHARFTKLFP